MPAGRDAVRELLDRGHDLDAVFCLTDTLAIGAMRGLADAGRAEPTISSRIGTRSAARRGPLVSGYCSRRRPPATPPRRP